LRDTDFMSMAHSVEVREPFLDHELLTLITSLPGSVKRQAGLKGLLRRAMAEDLPPEIVARKKMGFTLPFADWLKGPLRQPVADVLLDRNLGGQLTGLLDHQSVANAWGRFLSGSGSWTRPWSLYVLK